MEMHRLDPDLRAAEMYVCTAPLVQLALITERLCVSCSGFTGIEACGLRLFRAKRRCSLLRAVVEKPLLAYLGMQLHVNVDRPAGSQFHKFAGMEQSYAASGCCLLSLSMWLYSAQSKRKRQPEDNIKTHFLSHVVKVSFAAALACVDFFPLHEEQEAQTTCKGGRKELFRILLAGRQTSCG